MYHSISAQDFLTVCTEDAKVIDTREAHDFKESHLEQSVSIPLTALPNVWNTLDKEEIYYILSYNGVRSETMTEFLTKKGLQAVNVIGGMNAVAKARI